MDVDSLPAGRELDALVAEKVMGHSVSHPLPDFPDELWESEPLTKDGTWSYALWEYSTDIYAAWKVVGKIQETGMLDHLEQRDEAEGKYVVQFCAKPNEAWWHEHAYGDTVPLAICRAALKACGSESWPTGEVMPSKGV